MPAASDWARKIYNTVDDAVRENKIRAREQDITEDARRAQLGSLADSVKEFRFAEPTGATRALRPAYPQGPQAFPTEEDAFGGR